MSSRFAVDNPNTETADNVGIFGIWIIGTETGKICVLQLIIQIRKLPTMPAVCPQFPYLDSRLLNTKKMHFLIYNQNTETFENVGSSRIIKIRKLPTMSAVSV